MKSTQTKSQAEQQAEARGHLVVDDPPAMSGADRYTCLACGAAAIQYGTNIYGPAVEQDCIT
jgi:hypothetical protein